MNATSHSIKPSALKIGALFLAVSVASYLTIFIFDELGLFYPLISFTTIASAYLMKMAGLNPTLSLVGDQIGLDSRNLIITLECTAIFIMALYWSLIAAYPATLKRKLVGLAVGLTTIIFANLLRLLFLAAVSEKLPGYFDYVHDFLWQVAFVLLTAGLWLGWMTKDQHAAKTTVRP
jgi:exosortase/archaeosortase family protein